MNTSSHPRRRGKKRLLFLCTGNSCRSQMAEGWTRYRYGDGYDVYSAGTHPGKLDPRAVKVMAAAGMDISEHRVKHVNELLEIRFDLVITVCDAVREKCPWFPGNGHKLHCSFDDPPFLARDAESEEEALFHYRRIRDEIGAFVSGLPELMGQDQGTKNGQREG